MARYDHLPIFRRAMELTAEVENAVKHFPRYHKYTLGSELRTFCHQVLGLVAEANSTADRKAVLLRLRLVLERIKIHLVLAKEVQAFGRARTFYRITELAVDISRQNEGWLRSLGGHNPGGVKAMPGNVRNSHPGGKVRVASYFLHPAHPASGRLFQKR